MSMPNYLKMPKKSQVLALLELGWSYRRIERETGVRRETVSGYDAIRRGNPAKTFPGSDVSGRFAAARYHDAIVEKRGLGLTAQRIWQDLTEDFGYGHSYESVKRYLRTIAPRGRPVGVFESDPGQEGQVDFFRGAPTLDAATGQWKRPWVFRLTLACSRHGYEEAVWDQQLETFLRLHERAFRDLGGVDMCRNGQYTERGIKEIDGFMSERWRVEPEYAMSIDASLGMLGVLLEPATVVTKAWEQVVAVGQRAFWEPQIALVTGAGPIGLLAALVARQHGLDGHVLDRVESGPKPALVRALGATYHTGTVGGVGFQRDVIVECTGVGRVITDSIEAIAPGGVPYGRREWRAHRWPRDSGRGVQGSPRQQGGDRQRERQQAALVQGRTGAGTRRPWVACPARHEVRGTGGLHRRTPPAARRHQGRHPVRAGVIDAADVVFRTDYCVRTCDPSAGSAPRHTAPRTHAGDVHR
jgi:hypothetical protein